MDINKLLETVKNKRTEIESRKTNGVAFAKIPSGTSRWRILPGWRASEPHVFSHNFGQHWFKDADGKVLAVVVCDWDTFGEPCPYDQPIRDALRARREELTKLGLIKEQINQDSIVRALGEMQSRRVAVVNAIQIAGTGADPTKPVLLGLGATLEDGFVNLLHTALADNVNILDLATGHDVVIDKTGTGFNTEYKISMAVKSTAIDPSVMDKITNIDAFIKGERDKGAPKGADALNKAMAAALKIKSTSATASLLGGAGAPAAALAAPAPAVTAAPAPTAAPAVVAAATVLEQMPEPPKAPANANAEGFDDAELNELLAQIDGKAA